MKTLIKSIIPYTAMGTTLALLVTAIYNLIVGMDVRYYTNWLILICGIFLLYGIQFGVIERLEFKNSILYYVVVYAVWYLGLGTVLVITGWMGFGRKNMVIYTLVMTICYVLLYRYSFKKTQIAADEINALIEKQA